LIDLVDRLLRQPDGVFAVSTFVVFGLIEFVDGLLEIVSGIECGGIGLRKSWGDFPIYLDRPFALTP